MPPEFPHRIAVVGASLAGAHAAHALRRSSYDGEIVLFGAEHGAPYDRPPLSKAVLGGTRSIDEVRLRFFSGEGVSLRLGSAVQSLDAEARTVTVDGREEQFEGVVIATGSSPLRLDPVRFPGAMYLRTADDATALRAQLVAGKHLVIVGAGLIGCEVASTARGLGCAVTMIDPLAPCERSVGPEVAEILRSLHLAQGVDVRSGVTATGIDSAGPRSRVELSDGGVVEGDCVLIAVGARPETAWLAQSGLRLEDGVVCDETCLAAPGIVAAGDVARWRHPAPASGYARLEHWNNAVEQARHATDTLLAFLAGGAAAPYLPEPWFWSEQYGHRMQVAGWIADDCRIDVVDGELESLRFFAGYRRDTEQVGAVAIDSGKQFSAWLARTAVAPT